MNRAMPRKSATVVAFGVRWDPASLRWYVLEPDGRPALDLLGRRLSWDSFTLAWENRRIGRV
ncbi:hypothetical protein [Kitasatospora sp. NPDC094015]|uniref:hypothetical protein n=1 Tax=Kitasatospora sp. NPDC094015 TaxID=3155205 RepID=UPI003318025D